MSSRRLMRAGGRLLSGVLALALVACAAPDFGGDMSDQPSNSKERRSAGRNVPTQKSDSIFGEGGLALLGGGEGGQGGGAGAGVGVNSWLWRGSLDTISFMPLTTADPFGGVIITDWYTPPETPQERFKVNVYILGRELRADGVRAAVFRQRIDTNGNWIDSPVEPRTASDLEDAILTRARQLRVAALQQ